MTLFLGTSTLTINYTYVGTEGDDTIVLQPLPYLPNTVINYTLNYNGNGGSDLLRFTLSDFASSTSTINASFKGGAGIDTAVLDFDGADSIVSTTLGSGANAKVVYSYTAGDSSGSFTTDADVERLVIKGSAGNDQFTGGAGNDWFDGRGGFDTFAGSAGNDGYVFDTAGEQVTGELIGGGTDTIFATVSVDLNNNANVENLRLDGTDNIDATGNALANLITGNSGDNLIAGGLGKDSLYGKGGADTFSFDAFGAANTDSIWDFSSDDNISLDSWVFAGLDVDGGHVAAADFVRGTAATVVGQAQIIYNANSGIVSYDADGKGGVAAQSIAFVGKNLAYFDATHVLIDAGFLIA